MTIWGAAIDIPGVENLLKYEVSFVAHRLSQSAK